MINVIPKNVDIHLTDIGTHLNRRDHLNIMSRQGDRFIHCGDSVVIGNRNKLEPALLACVYYLEWIKQTVRIS